MWLIDVVLDLDDVFDEILVVFVDIDVFYCEMMSIFIVYVYDYKNGVLVNLYYLRSIINWFKVICFCIILDEVFFLV